MVTFFAVIQIYTNIANFTRLYFPYFTPIWHHTLQFYYSLDPLFSCSKKYCFFCLDRISVYYANCPLYPIFIFLNIRFFSFCREQGPKVWLIWPTPPSTRSTKAFLEGTLLTFILCSEGLFSWTRLLKFSFFSRPNCLQIAVRFGDTQMFYLCADTYDEANVSPPVVSAVL